MSESFKTLRERLKSRLNLSQPVFTNTIYVQNATKTPYLLVSHEGFLNYLQDLGYADGVINTLRKGFIRFCVEDDIIHIKSFAKMTGCRIKYYPARLFDFVESGHITNFKPYLEDIDNGFGIEAEGYEDK